jgi:hypothetical protein
LAEAEGYGKKWHNHKGHIIYDIEQAKFILANLVRTAGADILFDTLVVGAIVPDRILQGLIIESKSGREAVLAKAFVDSTGDADVAALSGASVLAAETLRLFQR